MRDRSTEKASRSLPVPNFAHKRLLTLAGIRAAWMQVPSAETILKRDRERLLSHTALTGPLNYEELSFAKELLAKMAASGSSFRSDGSRELSRAGYCHSFARLAESPGAISAPSRSPKPRAWLR
jgi:hypothetical protein